MVRKMPNSGLISTLSPSVKTKLLRRSFLQVRTIAICWAATDKTGRSMRLNSSKQPHEPDWARPGNQTHVISLCCKFNWTYNKIFIIPNCLFFVQLWFIKKSISGTHHSSQTAKIVFYFFWWRLVCNNIIPPICFVTLTFENSSQASEVHLVRTVEDHNILSQTAAHVFYGLGLA